MFVLNNNSVEKKIIIPQALFLFLHKKSRPKNKKNNHIDYFSILPIKMKPLIFLVFSQYG